MRFFAHFAAVGLMAIVSAWTTASAQDWSLEVEGEYVRLSVPPGAAAPTVDEVAERLAEHLGLPNVAGEIVRPGDVIFTAPMRYGRTWRLQNDLSRRGSQDVLLPRGTPLHETVFQYEVVGSGRLSDETLHDLRWRLWCAPPPVDVSRGEREICIRTRRGQAEAARRREYRSSSGTTFFPVTWPELVEDASAAAELPRRESVFVLRRASQRQISVQEFIRYGERAPEELDTLRIDSDADGGFVVPYGESASIALTPDGDGFRAELRTEPDIRALAASLLESTPQAQPDAAK